MWFKLAWQSLLNRKTTAILTFSALLVSVSLLFSIEHIRVQTQDNFKRTVSGIDLVVAARSSQVNVLLSSVFRIGANPNGISWGTYVDIASKEKVIWTIPLALGDSYKGFPVVGTSVDYFDYYQYGTKQALEIAKGRTFVSPSEAVIGANVASSLALKVGQSIVISHGAGKVSFSHHEHHPVLISGILAATGTPIDKSVHVPLIAIEKMHQVSSTASLRSSFDKSKPKDSEQHNDDVIHQQGDNKDADLDRADDENTSLANDHSHEHKDTLQVLPNIAPGTFDLIGQPTQISAFMLKANSPFAILTLQRDINQYQQEALSAIMPQVALSELWQTLGSVEAIMQVIAILVLFASLIGLVTMLLASMHERSNEISTLRAVGASPWFIASLIQAEAISISVLAIIGGYILVTISIVLAGNYLLTEYGLYISMNILSTGVLIYAGSVLFLTVIVALVPAFTAYRSAKYLFK
jgi:putative ABC transport system permease protein